ncbi:MAG: hypothetical protein GWP08_09310 [Nitrospiraceae bacterium]|nr:hypothetical protein [Nitrospiraceae bacterium]
MSVMFVSVLALGLLSGCATSGPSDEELVGDVVKGWTAAALAQDVDAMLKFYSDDFQNYEFGGKDGLGEFLTDAKDMGYLEDCEIDTEGAKIEIDGDTAEVYPVEMTAAFGSATLEFALKKEASGWMITAMDVEQY